MRNTKQLNSHVFPYIVDSIDSEGYGIKTETDEEKLSFLFNTFLHEKWTLEKQRYYDNIYDGFADWIAGLPSSFNIDFETHAILQLGYKWGSFSESDSEYKKMKMVGNWFNFITAKTFQLFKKHKIYPR